MRDDQSRPNDDAPEPPRLRALRQLVTILTATMILGLVTIIGLIVITLTRTPTGTALPSHITIPAGESAQAFTQGTNWIAVVTRDTAGAERIRILDPGTGDERQTVEIMALP